MSAPAAAPELPLEERAPSPDPPPPRADAPPPLNVIDAVPPEKINLRLLLVSGRKTDMLAGPQESVEAVRRRVFDSWPPEWADERPKSLQAVRILYRGRFLEGGNTLESQKIPAGQTTVIHIVLKQFDSAEAEASPEKPAKAAAAAEPSSRCCTIL
ncbi:ubiquitin-related domain-containing protein [Hyaloraphidium curvatum]|nr:ubiquitin-related domain-containing protein [Hyaloraphidium curvatum]